LRERQRVGSFEKITKSAERPSNCLGKLVVSFAHNQFFHSFSVPDLSAGMLLATVSETVSENSDGVLKNSGELSQIVLDVQRENPYSPRS
jgi:hypothetical protein